jgi:hypothetical protein
MEGTKMKNTKETMQMFLRSLSPGVLFNIVSFGSSFSMLFTQGSQEYNEARFRYEGQHGWHGDLQNAAIDTAFFLVEAFILVVFVV